MPGQHFPPAAIALFVAFFGFMLYRRFRRTVGRQPLAPRRLIFQIGLLGLVTLLFFVPTLAHPIAAASAAAGLLAGGVFGLFSLHLTRFERGPDRDYFTPNTYLGLGVFGVFLARLVYRSVQVSAQMQTLSASGQPPAAGLSSLTSSPLTAALLLLVFGYYLVYFSGLLLWVRRNPPGQANHGGFRPIRPA